MATLINTGVIQLEMHSTISIQFLDAGLGMIPRGTQRFGNETYLRDKNSSDGSSTVMS